MATDPWNAPSFETFIRVAASSNLMNLWNFNTLPRHGRIPCLHEELSRLTFQSNIDSDRFLDRYGPTSKYLQNRDAEFPDRALQSMRCQLSNPSKVENLNTRELCVFC